MKRLLLTILGTLMLISTHATGYETINGLRYLINSDDRTATLVAGTEKYSGDIVVPAKVTIAGIDYPVVAFGNECFKYCSDLTSVTIPSSVTNLGCEAFSNCSSLTSISIPSSVTSLGEYCFIGCSSLTSIDIPSSVTSLPEYCFCRCISLISISIPSSVTSLGNHCFGNCESLTNINIPASVTRLGYWCFSYCNSLVSVSIPSSVTSLGSNCFSGCNKMESLYSYPQNPPRIGTGNDNNSLSCPTTILYVPAASIEKYKQADGWKDFIAILPIKGTEGETKGKCEKPTISYTGGKLHFESATTGAEYHYTVGCSDVKTDAYSWDGNVSLAAAYNISVYATADGYSPSDKAYATLYWLNGSMNTSNINTAKTRGILASSEDGTVSLSGLDNGENVAFYSVDGRLIGRAAAVNGTASCAVGGTPVVIARVGDQSLKIVVN